MRALLDINVLIALLDAQHVHHQQATRWMTENIDGGWASCPLTQNGVIRIMSQPAYPNALPVGGEFSEDVGGGRFVCRCSLDLRKAGGSSGRGRSSLLYETLGPRRDQAVASVLGCTSRAISAASSLASNSFRSYWTCRFIQNRGAVLK